MIVDTTNHTTPVDETVYEIAYDDKKLEEKAEQLVNID